MAEQKELRHMSRTELIEIIYALQQRELELIRENGSLKEELKDRTIRLEEAGNIGEAALSLNHVFEDAQAAADQYLHSVTESEGEEAKQELSLEDVRDEAYRVVNEARWEVAAARLEAQKILKDAKAEAGKIIESAKAEGDRMILRMAELIRLRAKREDDL